MKYISSKVSLLLMCLLLVGGIAQAEAVKGVKQKPAKKAELERCRRGQGSAELNINNVRARINTSGNMWYDGSTARYFVPKDGNSTAMYCAALWIGGMDANDQLRVAALRFGQDGDDFWPGPLTVDRNASIDKSVCEKWDKHFIITRSEVEYFVAGFEYAADNKTVVGIDASRATDAIKNWPAHGDVSKNQSKFLAPFFDQNGNGVYEWEEGDYPYYDLSGELCPAKIKAELPAGSTYEPTPTFESNLENPNYGTGGSLEAYGGLLVDQVLKGDQTIWWVFNDKGNAHTESKSENPIGLEIRAQAFAFTMSDEINNMTFYSYEIINRSTFVLTNTYFSQWVDPDLGYAADDFVGCDVERGLGYCYNGKATDGPGTGAYDGNPPAIGIDFFQGPYMDPDGRDNPKVDTNAFIDFYGAAALDAYRDSVGNINPILLTDDAYKWKNAWYPKSKDPIDACAINGVNFGNGIVDDERFGMRRFIYYNNDGTANNGEPDKATDYYNYLRGIWRDGKRMCYGGDGYNAGSAGYQEGIYSDFMFPGTSDIWGWGTASNGNENVGKSTEWTEQTAGNSADDRRFMQSAGPFTLQPGAINYITVGIPFAQATTGGPAASVELLRQIDDKCQALFDNCFNVLEGPDAPQVVVQELDRQIILYLTNEAGNNVNESFNVTDVTIPRSYTLKGADGQDSIEIDYDRNYRFEGYQIFQVKDESVSVADIYDQDKSRLIAQCDIENYDSLQNNQPIGELVNWTKVNGRLSSQVMVSGENKGIRHSFLITEDKFSNNNDKRIVNNQKYYYIAVAYAYNNYKPYNNEDPTKLDGQKEPYLASRKVGGGGAIEPVVAIPHMTNSEQNGTLVQSTYGMSPEIIRLEGQGNGGMILNFDKSTLAQLMGAPGENPTEGMDGVDGKYNNFVETPMYATNYGPLNIKIVDPLKLRTGSYLIRIEPSVSGVMNESDWVLTNADPTQPVYDDVMEIRSSRPIGEINEEILFELGISVQLTNPKAVANSNAASISGKESLGGDLIEGSLLASSITFANPAKTWLGGISDNDGMEKTDWIRAGGVMGADDQTLQTTWLDYYHKGTMNSNGMAIKSPMDARSEYENCVGGWWAPYRLTSAANQHMHPAFVEAHFFTADDAMFGADSAYLTDASKIPSLICNDMNNLASVDIVFTNDKSKWTRCPVIEMGIDPVLTEGGAKRFALRNHPSVDKEGNEINDGTKGMGWFPGYAINLETGERLNLIFGENSSLGHHNGRDLLWNPSSVTADQGGYVFGGMHYIYVLGTSQVKYLNNETVTPTRYDEGAWAYEILRKLANVTALNGSGIDGENNQRAIKGAHQLFSSVMWVGMPLATCFEYGSANVELEKKSQSLIPTDATVSIRVRKPYNKNWSNLGGGAMSATPMNDNNPMYQFTIDGGLATIIGHKETAESALDNITVVPNPYYAASLYERDQIQNLVKITNLPPDCYITIFSVDGTVVRKLRGPSASLVSGGGTALTSVDWDLKNHKGLPISGGVYLIHIKADGVGEKLIKWFGALRPVDLNSFQ